MGLLIERHVSSNQEKKMVPFFQYGVEWSPQWFDDRKESTGILISSPNPKFFNSQFATINTPKHDGNGMRVYVGQFVVLTDEDQIEVYDNLEKLFGKYELYTDKSVREIISQGVELEIRSPEVHISEIRHVPLNLEAAHNTLQDADRRIEEAKNGNLDLKEEGMDGYRKGDLNSYDILRAMITDAMRRYDIHVNDVIVNEDDVKPFTVEEIIGALQNTHPMSAGAFVKWCQLLGIIMQPHEDFGGYDSTSLLTEYNRRKIQMSRELRQHVPNKILHDLVMTTMGSVLFHMTDPRSVERTEEFKKMMGDHLFPTHYKYGFSLPERKDVVRPNPKIIMGKSSDRTTETINEVIPKLLNRILNTLTSTHEMLGVKPDDVYNYLQYHTSMEGSVCDDMIDQITSIASEYTRDELSNKTTDELADILSKIKAIPTVSPVACSGEVLLDHESTEKIEDAAKLIQDDSKEAIIQSILSLSNQYSPEYLETKDLDDLVPLNIRLKELIQYLKLQAEEVVKIFTDPQFSTQQTNMFNQLIDIVTQFNVGYRVEDLEKESFAKVLAIYNHHMSILDK